MARGGAGAESLDILRLHVLLSSAGESIPPTSAVTWQQFSANRPATTIPVFRLHCVSFFLHHAEILTVTGKSYRLRGRGEVSNGAKALTGSQKNQKGPKQTKAPTGSDAEKKTETTN
jgi:hypothetical protein